MEWEYIDFKYFEKTVVHWIKCKRSFKSCSRIKLVRDKFPLSFKKKSVKYFF